MPKFILIDHSITDFGGHHYEYAVHVLQAAKDAGYRPVLAANRKFKAEGQAPWEIQAVYRYGFWAESPDGLLRRWIGLALSTVGQKMNWLKIWLAYSYLGLLQSAQEPNTYHDALRRPLWQIVRPTFLLILLLGYWLSLARYLDRLVRVAVPLAGYCHQLFGALKDLASQALFPADLFLKSWPRLREKRQEQHRIRQFGDDTRRLLRRVQLEEGDLVFIPTLSLTDTLGLLRYFHAESRSTLATWHLLFRRNIYDGRELDYAGQDRNLEPTRQSFRYFQASLTGQRVFLYTDTEKLSDQYNRLTDIPFAVLPIPHTHAPAKASPLDGQPIRIIYVGDARHEKGYHYLPGVVQDLWADYVETNRVTFVLQSNFSVPQGETEAVVARGQLQCYPPDKVGLITRPLSSAEYRETLLSGDISLLMYDSRAYYARSSGILIESLAAGIPVLVPAGTWLADQFRDEVHRHQLSIKKQMWVLKTYIDSQLYWRKQPASNFRPLLPGTPADLARGPIAWCTVGIPAGARHISLSLRLPRKDLFAEMGVDQLDCNARSIRRSLLVLGKENEKGFVSTVVPLESDAANILLTFASASADVPAKSKIRLEFLQPEDPLQRYPTSAVGLIFTDHEEISGLLKEMIDNYAHYRRTAQAFAPKVLEKHNATRLVEDLKRASGQLISVEDTTAMALDGQRAEQISLAR